MFIDDYIQTMTISKPRGSKQIKVLVQLQEIGNMSLHISNLLRGRVIIGKFLMYIINVLIIIIVIINIYKQFKYITHYIIIIFIFVIIIIICI